MKYDFDLELVNSNSLLLILEQIKRNTTILEFGPANGRMTKYLNEQLNCSVYLAELDEASGKQALQYGKKLVVGDIENYEWFEKYQDIKFDYIIFADVLEHLRDPQKVMAKSKMLLKNDGSILLSVPNFAHNAILINLINNDFQYRDIGLLDNTHIHMFTKNSLENMLYDIELFPVKRMATYSKVGKNEIPADIHWNKGIDDFVWNTRPYGEVYQFVYEVKKGKEFIEEEMNSLSYTLNHYYLQFYTDNGNGLSEELSVKKKIHQFDAENVFVFELEQNVERFRIDPVNHKVLAKVICYAIKGQERKRITAVLANDSFNNGEIYCFDNDDPWMNFENTDKAEKIEVHVTYYSMAQSAVESIGIFKHELNDMKEYEIEKSNLVQEKKQLEERIASLENERVHLIGQINAFAENRKKIESNIFYKIYKKILRH
ncbi:MAG: class I SAM-dependent methyltransferase [Lachnospiraceae bacterium]|nr:class I SAM-dependent methyltransferase [Lachnospiraceae bacterium]